MRFVEISERQFCIGFMFKLIREYSKVMITRSHLSRAKELAKHLPKPLPYLLRRVYALLRRSYALLRRAYALLRQLKTITSHFSTNILSAVMWINVFLGFSKDLKANSNFRKKFSSREILTDVLIYSRLPLNIFDGLNICADSLNIGISRLEQFCRKFENCSFYENARFLLVRAYILSSRHEDAEMHIREQIDKNMVSMILDHAHFYRNLGLFEDALQLFKVVWFKGLLQVPHNGLSPALEAESGFFASGSEYAGYSIDMEKHNEKYFNFLEKKTVEALGDLNFRPVSMESTTGSFGDLASRIDALVKLNNLNMIDPQVIELMKPPGSEFANQTLAKMIARIVPLRPDENSYKQAKSKYPWFAWRDLTYFQMPNGKVIHNTLACALADVEWQRQSNEPLLKLLDVDLKAGWSQLESLGLSKDDWFVTLHVRDAGFYDEFGSGNASLSSHRNSYIETYNTAIQWILDQGGWVFRLGDSKSQKHDFEHEHFVNYAHSSYQSDWMDMFLIAESRYLVCSNSGPMCVATSMGVPTAVVNYLPMATPPLSSENIFIPKMFWWDDEMRFLTFNEMLQDPFRNANRNFLYILLSTKLGIKPIDNTSDEILGCVMQLHDQVMNKTRYHSAGHAALEKLFSDNAAYYITRMGDVFLEKYESLGCLNSKANPKIIDKWSALASSTKYISTEEFLSVAEQNRLSNPERSLQLYIELLSVDDQNVEALRNIPKCLYLTGRTEQAIQKQKFLLEDSRFVNDIEAYRELINWLKELNKEDEATIYYEKIEDTWPSSMMDLLSYGHHLRQLGKNEAAIKTFLKIIEISKTEFHSSRHNEGIIAAACEYAGEHDEGRHWMSSFQSTLDDMSAPVFSQGEPLIVSLGRLNTRIGDVAARFDLLKKGQVLGMLELPTDNILIDATEKYVNEPYINLWQDQLTFLGPERAEEINAANWNQKRDLANVKMHDKRCHYYPIAYSIIQQEWIKQGRSPLISISQESKKKGWETLNKFGMSEGDWFVVLHVREGGFFNEDVVGPNSDHTHRSANIANYGKAIDWIISQGGWVIRIGDPTMTKLSSRKRLIDYANSNLKSAEMDCFLLETARYLLGTNSGPMAVATSFGTPCGITNYVPIAFPVCSPHNLMLPKMLYSHREERYLTIEELMSAPIGFANRAHIYNLFCKRFGVELLENSPTEILNFTKDLHKWCNSKFVSADPRHQKISSIFASKNAIYISQFSKSWLDKYEALGCLDPSPRLVPFVDEWRSPISIREGFIDQLELSNFDFKKAFSDLEQGIKSSFPENKQLLETIAKIMLSPSANSLEKLADELHQLGAYGIALECMIAAYNLNQEKLDSNKVKEGVDAKQVASTLVLKTFLPKLATLASLLGRLKLGFSVLNHLLDSGHFSRETVTLACRLSLDSGNYENALKSYEKMLAFDKLSALHGMGLANHHLQRIGKSISCFERALEIAPDSYSTWKCLLAVHWESAHYREAVHVLRHMQQSDNAEDFIDFKLVKAYVILGDTLNAKKCLETISKRREYDPVYRDVNATAFAKAQELCASTSVNFALSGTTKSRQLFGDEPPLEPANNKPKKSIDKKQHLYIDLLMRSILNITNQSTDLVTYKLANAALEGAHLSLHDVKALSKPKSNEIEKQYLANLNGQWTFNDPTEFLTTGRLSMLGICGLQSIVDSVHSILDEDVPGDLVECGVWRGGSTILMRGLLHVRGDENRKVWVCDSFEGLPTVDFESESKLFGTDLEWASVSEDDVKRNFSRFGLLDDRVEFVKGWFAETLSKAPIKSISVLRLDGDYYSSTMDILVALYDRVSNGGYVIVDDYNSVATCKQAISAYFHERDLPMPKMQRVDKHCVFWRKY
ncbi:TIGR04372 family glycosyltransferase [Alphaproteobacteria bacterium]|nr:TIGR04372 family glycosyltransferase [Alphaproteobacteria bacterium]